MESIRRKNASLAINAIIRGLEFDQLTFHYDESGYPDIAYVDGGRDVGARESHTDLIATSRSALRELQPLKQTTSAA